MWQAVVGFVGVVSAVVAWKLATQGERSTAPSPAAGPRITSPWMVVEGWRANTLVLRTRAQPGLSLSLPLEPLRSGKAKLNDDVICMLDGGVLPPVQTADALGDGQPWEEVETGTFEVQIGEVRVRITSHTERPVIDRVAPLPNPQLYGVPELCPGEPNPFPELHARWNEAFPEAPLGTELLPLTQRALPPVQHGQTEADLFADAAEQSVLGSLDEGFPGIGDLDEDALIALGNDGTGDALVGALTPQGSVASFWIGHDPPGVFFRGPSLLLLLERLILEEDVEGAVSAWGVLDEAGGSAVPLPPCYLSGSGNLETKLDAQPQNRFVLDFRGRPAGHSYEDMEGFPAELIEGLVLVMQH